MPSALHPSVWKTKWGKAPAGPPSEGYPVLPAPHIPVLKGLQSPWQHHIHTRTACHPVILFLIHDRLDVPFVIVQVTLRTEERQSHGCGSVIFARMIQRIYANELRYGSLVLTILTGGHYGLSIRNQTDRGLSPVPHALHETFGFCTSKQIVPIKKMRNICSQTKKPKA